FNPLPIPGFPMDHPFLVVSSYDFVLNTMTLTEVDPAPPIPGPDERQITAGIDLLASGVLPDSIPAVGGSAVQIAGVLPADLDLTQTSIEAKIVLAHPPVIADLFKFTSVGLEITGAPSLAVFGEGVVLHDHIPSLSQDIAVKAELKLDIINTTLEG